MKTKKYLLFAGSNYYPDGGWDDFKGSFDSMEKAVEHRWDESSCDWFHVVNIETGEKVAGGAK